MFFVMDSKVEIVICDFGSGFLDSEIEVLLKCYVWGYNVEGVVGLGFGLIIVDEVMCVYGGIIMLINNIGGGVCVILFFFLD